MEINKDIFECAVNSLNINELRVILEKNNILINIKDKKHEIIQQLLSLIDANKITEQLYLDIRTKAFSESDNFNEGFYYKYSSDNINFHYDKFIEFLYSEMDKNKVSRHNTTHTFEYEAYGISHDEQNKIIKFTFCRKTRDRRYDYVDKNVKIFNGKIKADIEIYYEESIVYIRNKNYNNSTAIKFFLQKVFNDLRIDTKSNKVRLYIPKFNNQIVNKWSSENNFNIKGISSVTIHMLDLLSEFKNVKNKFSSYCMKKIFFDNEIIDAAEKNVIKGSIFFGDDIQECIEISEGIIEGKKINGFELQVDYLYTNEESGVEQEIVQVPITILQESNTFRVAISKEIDHVEKNILSDLYECIRQVFLNKLNSKEINNTESIINFINKAHEILKKEKGGESEATKAESIIL